MLTRRGEMEQKWRTVIAYLDDHQLDAIILSRRCNFAWFTAGGLNHVSTAADVGAASLLITREDISCITSTIEAPRIGAEELSDLGIDMQVHLWYDAADTDQTWAKAIVNRRTACDARIAGLPASVKPLDADFDRLRWTLNEAEVERYRALGREVAECLESACRKARPGMSEHTLASLVAGNLLERAIRPPVLLIAADERVERYRHPIPADKKFRNYGMAVACGERSGLLVSCTRLFSFKPIDALLARKHEAVCAVDAALIAASRPGRSLGEVFAVGQKTYAELGFAEEWTLHHQGGLTGYVGREVRGAPGSILEIQTNQAFAWNPSITGTKSEDTIIVGERDNEIISATGGWPTRMYEAGGRSWPRSDILVV
ncbi:MAG: M24 family metallopeptidase [Phycisphaerales bacterium]|nr:M24 family metallopeptidase [Phycisphaerales bacterium]